MKPKKILIILGTADEKSFSSALANQYQEGAKEVGHEVKQLSLGQINFDPILWKGYKEVQELEPDLKQAQEDIKWADHVAIFYPIWWGTMPAILKGFFDRVLLPGFAFKFNDNGKGWQKLLKGRSARVIVALDNWSWISYFMFGDFTDEIKRSMLRFVGFSPVKSSSFGRISASKKKRQKALKKVFKLGEKGE